MDSRTRVARQIITNFITQNLLLTEEFKFITWLLTVTGGSSGIPRTLTGGDLI